MKLHELPADIVSLLPQYLYSLEDLYALIRTCRAFHTCCYDEKVKLRPSFAKRYGQRLFPPHPHLLIGGAARSVADWAVSSKSNERELQEALKGGIEGLLQICAEEGRMSLHDARALTAAKYDILNPMSRMVDEAMGPSERARHDAADDRTLDDDQGEWWTIMEYPELSVLNHWIYCELFHHNIDNCLMVEASKHVQLGCKTRVLFLSYCIPDCNNRLLKVPPGIFQQAYSFAKTPWDTTEHGSPIACFLQFQEQLYKEEFSPVTVLAINNALTEGSEEVPSNVSDLFLCVLILHKPLLCFRLLLPGGRAATKAEVEALEAEIPAEVPKYFHEEEEDGDHYAEDDSNIKDKTDLPDDWEGWPWRGIEDDCLRIVWGY